MDPEFAKLVIWQDDKVFYFEGPAGEDIPIRRDMSEIAALNILGKRGFDIFDTDKSGTAAYPKRTYRLRRYKTA